MSLSKWIVLLLILCCSTSCQSEGASGSSSSPCTSTRVYVDEEDSLSAQINRAWCDRKKISIEILFQNNGAEPVQFPLEGLTVEVGGRSVVGRGTLGASMESEIVLEPYQAKPRRYVFATIAFGAGEPKPGKYVLRVAGIKDGEGELIDRDLMVPFEIPGGE
jgi:hypothetical protein